jgi:hypothetical protein
MHIYFAFPACFSGGSETPSQRTDRTLVSSQNIGPLTFYRLI